MNPDLYSLLCAFVAGALFCVAAPLLFLRVPAMAAWQSFSRARFFTAVASIVLGIAYGSSALMGWTFGVPVLFAWFVVASLQALLFTFTCVVFVAPQTPMRRLVFRNLIPIAVLTALMASAFSVAPGWGWALLVAAVVCYLVQLAFYTRYFITVYRSNIAYLEEVYADDLAPRLAWVRRLFCSALAVGVLAVAVILLMSQTIDVVFGLVVAVYYTYVAIGFINYMSRAAFVVKAAIERGEAQARFVPSGREQALPSVKAAALTEAPAPAETPAPAGACGPDATDASSLGCIRQAVDDWVAARRYLEPDISVEEIARQMGVDRQALNDFFATVLQKPLRSWRIELRIREAQRLLAADASIATGELCNRCGYNDRSNFHKHFLKVTGQSLADYRSTVQRG